MKVHEHMHPGVPFLNRNQLELKHKKHLAVPSAELFDQGTNVDYTVSN